MSPTQQNYYDIHITFSKVIITKALETLLGAAQNVYKNTFHFDSFNQPTGHSNVSFSAAKILF